MWCILFPFTYLLTYFLDSVMSKGQVRRMDNGKKVEQQRLDLKRGYPK